MLKHLKKAGMKAATSPAAMKILTNPGVQKVMMRAIKLPSDVRDIVDKNAKTLAKTLNLVTKEDVASLKRTLRDLEGDVKRLQRQLAEERDRFANAVKTREAAAGGNGEIHTTPPPAAPAAESGPKKVKIVAKKKAPDA